MDSLDFKYLSHIINALEKFYQNDYDLILSGRHTHEQTISFRIAMYLAEQLESIDDKHYVDCEYHGDIYNPARRKIINGQKIRPDIIYHDRDVQNIFCIEMKIGSMTQHDYDKINGLISDYGYSEGYCIHNVGRRFVTVNAISSEHTERGIRYRFKYCASKNSLEQTI